jgi:hypothetical protein
LGVRIPPNAQNAQVRACDFFTDDPTRLASAVNALVVVAGRNGWGVELIRSTPTFHRLELTCDDETVHVDIAVDSP